MLTINNQIARQFILGKQGLWPGRRWRGLEGTAQAMREAEYLQIDPLQAIARSHDITLYGRVLDSSVTALLVFVLRTVIGVPVGAPGPFMKPSLRYYRGAERQEETLQRGAL